MRRVLCICLVPVASSMFPLQQQLHNFYISNSGCHDRRAPLSRVRYHLVRSRARNLKPWSDPKLLYFMSSLSKLFNTLYTSHANLEMAKISPTEYPKAHLKASGDGI
ncbi:hypothetical protein BGX38DRAFT_1167929 [Terfezia claveryi]|nr:hypothetical protein BGX38DRAFT_1167929 [Terfezia claveryi]